MNMEPAIVEALVSAIGDGSIGVIVGASLTIIVFLLRRVVSPVIPKKELPLFTSGLAVVLVVGAGLAAGVDWLSALLSGLLVGAAAVGFWELLGKRLKHWIKGDADDVSSESEDS